jgi:hypothetical protein
MVNAGEDKSEGGICRYNIAESDPTFMPAAAPSDKATDGKDKSRLDGAGPAVAEFVVGRWKASWILEETRSSSDLGDMCLASLATDRGEICFVRDGCRKA